MAITRASGFPAYGSLSGANGSTPITVVNSGDLMIAATWIFPDTDTVTGVTSARVPTWTNAVTLNDTTNGLWLAIWTGVSASTGTDTVLFTTTGGTPSFAAWGVDELTAPSPTWTVHANGSNPGTTGTTLTWPSLTAGDSNSAYWGFCTVGAGTLSAGSTSGFTYTIQGTETAIVTDLGLTNATAYQPTMPVSASTDWDTMGIIVSAGTGGGGSSSGPGSFFAFFSDGGPGGAGGVPTNITPPVIS